MKRGFVLVALVLLSCILFSSLASAQFENFSISAFAQNEWVNAALIFLLMFSFLWFVFQRVFKSAPGAALVASIVFGIIASFGIVYYYGAVIGRFGNIFLLLLVAAIVFLLWLQLRRFKISLFFILLAVTLVWLFYARGQLCPPLGILPQELCLLLDTAAIVILLVSVVKLIIWLIGKLTGHVPQVNFPGGGMFGGGRPPREPREPRQPRERARRMPGAPRIRFFARPTRIRQGQGARLIWRARNANVVGIAGVGEFGPRGQVPVAPNETTTYIAIARGPGGESRAHATVIVIGRGQPQQQPQQQQRQPAQQLVRRQRDLQALYDRYANETKAVTSRWRRIPSRNSNNPAERADGRIYHNNIRRMRAIESMARKARITLH